MSLISYNESSNSIDINKNLSNKPPTTARKYISSFPLSAKKYSDSTVQNRDLNNETSEKYITLAKFISLLNTQVKEMQLNFFQKFKAALSASREKSNKTSQLFQIPYKDNQDSGLNNSTLQNNLSNWESDPNLSSSHHGSLKQSFQKMFFNKKRNIFSPIDKRRDSKNFNRSLSPPTSNF